MPAARMPALLRHLRPGDRVAVIAPAGPPKPEQLPEVEALFASHGLKARLYPSCQARHPQHEYLAGDDALRLADLHAALADDSMRAIFCARGGYGCTRLLAGVDRALVRNRNKLLVGYSDVTALHAVWQAEGLASVHAPMPASDLVLEGAEEDARATFELLLQSPVPNPKPTPTAAPHLAPALLAAAWRIEGRAGPRATGPLVGGNLSLLAALVGTPWQPDFGGAVVFLEEVGESLYRVDRMLGQLRHAGLLQAAAGFLIGSFTEEEDPAAVLRDYLGGLGKPVLAGWPSGHGRPNRPLVLGPRVTLDVAAGTLQYETAVFA